MAVRQRIRTHNVTRVRMPVTVMGVKTRTLVDVCSQCFIAGSSLRQHICRGTALKTWPMWLEERGAEEVNERYSPETP